MRYFAFSDKILLCFLQAMVFALISCKETEVAIALEDQDTPENEYIEPAVEQFKEPSDLKISPKKARNFNKASEALVFMGQEWAEKMSQVDNEEKLKMAASYEKAQDDLIRKFGIKGKEEFKWIHAKALPESINRDVFARAGIWINR
ncbi:hypothetical protein R83H12_00026 [Fibrobacteria bacterium R8-3-H12]